MGNRITRVDIAGLRRWADDMDYTVFYDTGYRLVDSMTGIFTADTFSINIFTVLKHGVPP